MKLKLQLSLSLFLSFSLSFTLCLHVQLKQADRDPAFTSNQKIRHRKTAVERLHDFADHPNKEQFGQYLAQWKEYEQQMEERGKDLESRRHTLEKAIKGSSSTATQQGPPAGAPQAGNTAGGSQPSTGGPQVPTQGQGSLLRGHGPNQYQGPTGGPGAGLRGPGAAGMTQQGPGGSGPGQQQSGGYYADRPDQRQGQYRGGPPDSSPIAPQQRGPGTPGGSLHPGSSKQVTAISCCLSVSVSVSVSCTS